MPSIKLPTDKSSLCELGAKLIERFCKLNDLPKPPIKVVLSKDWCVSACAYYRAYHNSSRGNGIFICLERCASPCSQEQIRNWNWPGNTVDREPCGVLCHELGHHVDVCFSKDKGKYGGDYSVKTEAAAMEAPISGYSPNPWEWFAEMFRVFVVNPSLLEQLRPNTYAILIERLKPLPEKQRHWKTNLGGNVPPKIIKALINKGAKR